jgi:hypothetical protein
MMQLLAGHVGGGDYLKKKNSTATVDQNSLKNITHSLFIYVQGI